MKPDLNTLGRLYPYVNYRFKNRFLWNRYYNRLSEPKLRRAILATADKTAALNAQLKQYQFNLNNTKVNVKDYQAYLKEANYSQYRYYYKGGRAQNFPEKSLEHYLAAKLLDLKPSDVYVDIANGYSPTPEIYSHLYGCDSYKQDLIYPKGVQDRVIGGDACKMPVSDGFFSKMGMHCSFEHFVGDGDIRFIREADRVLSRGGRLCIVPLYLFSEYAIQTNPVCVPKGFMFEDNAKLYCVKQWQVHHSRFYDVAHLAERIRSNLGKLELTVHAIGNPEEVDSSCYVRYAAVLEKK